MPIPTWPGSLPVLPTTNYSEDSGVLILRTPVDAGPAKQRRRGKRPSNLNVTYEMTNTQVSTFETFVNDTLLGISRFTITHPRKLTTVDVRIVPQNDGKLYDCNYVLQNVWQVSFQLEVLP